MDLWILIIYGFIEWSYILTNDRICIHKQDGLNVLFIY